jgi:putative N6-adenine-specific DNA methylase
MRLFASCAPGLEAVLGREIEALGAKNGLAIAHAGVFFDGGTRDLYAANLWLRSASRVQWILLQAQERSRAGLVDAVAQIPWPDLLRPERGVAIELHDAGLTAPARREVAEQLTRAVRSRLGARAEAVHPAVAVVHCHRGQLTVGLDSSGKALHKRGYRTTGTHEAPLQETLAAAILLELGYRGEEPLWDPMCGSGTFAIEGAMIAVHKAPMIHRKKGQFAFEWWRDFDYALWRQVSTEARGARHPAPAHPILASDAQARWVREAAVNATRARVRHHITFLASRFESVASPREPGLLVMNLPYGSRLGSERELRPLYRRVGSLVRERFARWRTGLLVLDAPPSEELGLDLASAMPIANGALRCRLLRAGS